MGSITLDIFFVNIPSLVMEIKVSKLSLGNPINQVLILQILCTIQE